jgi:hypothetical protein
MTQVAEASWERVDWNLTGITDLYFPFRNTLFALEIVPASFVTKQD